MIASSARLDAFFSDLRQGGMDIGPLDIARVNAVLFALEADRRMPVRINELAAYIAPLLCRSATTQREFVDRFVHWAPLLVLPDDADPQRLPTSQNSEITKTAHWLRRWRILGVTAAGGLLLLAGLVLAFLLANPAPNFNPLVAPISPIPSAASGLLMGKLPITASGILHLTVAIVPIPLLWWWWYARRRHIAVIERRFLPERPTLSRVPLAARPGLIDTNNRLRAILPRLRRRREESSTELDVSRTIAATLEAENLITPVYAKRPREPEYLLLVNRVSPRDLLPDLGRQLAAAMAQAQIRVSLWEFNSDPRICISVDRSHIALPIQELAARYGDHRLLILADVSELLHPLTGRVWPWLAYFEAWQERYILAPPASTGWGLDGAVLADSGFVLLEAGCAGLGTLAKQLEIGDERVTTDASYEKFPVADYIATLRSSEHLWLREVPDTNVSDHLRRFLSAPAFNWLAACAVFPMIQPDLTQHLSNTIVTEPTDPAQRETALFELTRLPWFRHGLMPDALRLILIHELPSALMQKVEGALRRYLVPGSGGETQAEFAREDRMVWRQLTTTLFRTTVDSRVGRDYLFLSIMAGRRPNRLAVRAPEWLRLLLVRSDLPDILLACCVALAASIALWIGFDIVIKPIAAAIAHVLTALGQTTARTIPVLIDVAVRAGRYGSTVAAFAYWAFRVLGGPPPNKSSDLLLPASVLLVAYISFLGPSEADDLFKIKGLTPTLISALVCSSLMMQVARRRRSINRAILRRGLAAANVLWPAYLLAILQQLLVAGMHQIRSDAFIPFQEPLALAIAAGVVLVSLKDTLKLSAREITTILGQASSLALLGEAVWLALLPESLAFLGTAIGIVIFALGGLMAGHRLRLLQIRAVAIAVFYTVTAALAALTLSPAESRTLLLFNLLMCFAFSYRIRLSGMTMLGIWFSALLSISGEWFYLIPHLLRTSVELFTTYSKEMLSPTSDQKIWYRIYSPLLWGLTWMVFCAATRERKAVGERVGHALALMLWKIGSTFHKHPVTVARDPEDASEPLATEARSGSPSRSHRG